MTVIVGYKDDNKIRLAADNRVYTEETGEVRDDDSKIIVVNDNVAVACAGYNGTQILLEKMLEITKNKDKLRVDNILVLLKRIYRFCKICWFIRGTKKILKMGSRFMVGGKNRNNEYCIYAISIMSGKIEKPLLTKMFIFPPSDVLPKECWDYYTKNMKNFKGDFLQRTIKDISDKSKYVSSTGDIWTYNLNTETSSMEHFN